MAKKKENKPTTDILLSSDLKLSTDSNPSFQPKSTHRYALNAVKKPGDNRLFFERGNEIFSNLKPDYVIIGNVYIGNERVVLFSVNSKLNASEIGILDLTEKKYITHVNDSLSQDKDKLGFSPFKQIQATYALRRGCEDVVYFCHKGAEPKFYNFSSSQSFKNPDGTWNKDLFKIQKNYSQIPVFQSVKVNDFGGNLLPGSYYIAICLLDKNLNETEYITSTEGVKIYNDSLNKTFKDIQGSINSAEEYYNFSNTNKSIEISLSNIDSKFRFFKLAFIEVNSGSGEISRVRLTDVLSVDNPTFTYTGNNFISEVPKEEIQKFTDIIGEAESILQLENMLLLGNVAGKQRDYCRLQKFASKIRVDGYLKTVYLNDITDQDNPKNPLVDFEGRGYMPGEMYSFGIVYIYEDGTVSPVYHIPGKSSVADEKDIYSPKFDNKGNPLTFPMSKDNEIEFRYTQNEDCSSRDLWGKDSEGVSLKGKKVRHHRFPLRSEIGTPLVEKVLSDELKVKHHQLEINIKGNLKVPILCDPGDSECQPEYFNPFSLKVTYNLGGEAFEFEQYVDPNEFSFYESIYNIDLTQVSRYHSSEDFYNIRVYIYGDDHEYHEIPLSDGAGQYNNNYGDYFSGAATITVKKSLFTSTVQGAIYKTQIYGVLFSGIDIPKLENEKIIGYYIVRNERREEDKTILDSGVITPTVEYNNFVSHGLLQPDTNRKSNQIFSLIHPEHKFRDREYTNYDEIIQEGHFRVKDVKYGKVNYDDVFEGSSYDPKRMKDGNDDGHHETPEPYTRGMDGFSINILSRDSILEFESKRDFEISKEEIEDRFYLSALESKSIDDSKIDVYNIAADNKIGIFQLKNPNDKILKSNLPYVVLRKKNLSSYANYKYLPYYKVSMNPTTFEEDEVQSETVVFGGDSYVCPMRYVNTIFWDNRIALRAGKKSILKIILGSVIALAGLILAYFSGGASTPLVVAGIGLAAAGFGVSMMNSGIKQSNWNKAYTKAYEEGLRETALDAWVDIFYNYKNGVGSYFPIAWTGQTEHSGKHAKNGPSDDTIQWIGDCVTDLWFDTSINISLRHGTTGVAPDFLAAPGKIESGQDSPIKLWEFFKIHYADSNQRRYPISNLEYHLAGKLLLFDAERKDNKYYLGIPAGELYQINPDYIVNNNLKFYFHLPTEYDCCSDCNEKFPHRWRWSEQSFQEELTDNYRKFLSNNYRDIEGSSGEIMNMFINSGKLYIHTKEALWEVPKNNQERVTDGVVSFIGTGSFFEIPPRKIVEDTTGNSKGLKYKWSALKTPENYFFVSHDGFYRFNTEGLVKISDIGITNWIDNNKEISLDTFYRRQTGKDYPAKDNPSSEYGTGYLLGYDSKLRRILFTKKDFVLSEEITSKTSFEIAIHEGNIILFENIDLIIQHHKSLGYVYEGIKDSRLLFSKDIIKTVTKTVYEWIPPEIEYVDKHYRTHFRGDIDRDSGAFDPIDNPLPGDPNSGPPIPVIGGRVTYIGFPSGEEEVLEDIFSDDCISVINTEIISYVHCYPGCRQEEILGGPMVVKPGYFDYVTKEVEILDTEFKYVEGRVIENPIKYNKSWTLSFSTQSNKEPYWISWHSYTPNHYISVLDKLLSYENPFKKLSGNNFSVQNSIWEHNVSKFFGRYYQRNNSFIVEFVSLSDPIQTKIWNHIRLNTKATRYTSEYSEGYEERLITFNKAVLYNSTQCSGLLTLKVKEDMADSVDFMSQQIQNDSNSIIEKKEEDWYFNDFRNIRINNNSPIWKDEVENEGLDYKVDKVLNLNSLDEDKYWAEMENFRGKYLIVRLIFDRFADVELSLDYSVQNITVSE